MTHWTNKDFPSQHTFYYNNKTLQNQDVNIGNQLTRYIAKHWLYLNYKYIQAYFAIIISVFSLFEWIKYQVAFYGVYNKILHIILKHSLMQF
jgi:hypothetical protein